MGPEHYEVLMLYQTLISKIVNDEKKLKRIHFNSSIAQNPAALPRMVIVAADSDQYKCQFKQIADHVKPYLSLQKEDENSHLFGLIFSWASVRMIWIKGHLSQENVRFFHIELFWQVFERMIESWLHNDRLNPSNYGVFSPFYILMEFIKKIVNDEPV